MAQLISLWTLVNLELDHLLDQLVDQFFSIAVITSLNEVSGLLSPTALQEDKKQLN